MVNFKKLADRARDIVEQQGGPDALKEKAQRMKDAASRPGSMSDKAKAAAGSLTGTSRIRASRMMPSHPTSAPSSGPSRNRPTRCRATPAPSVA